jgi:hypothetical protein
LPVRRGGRFEDQRDCGCPQLDRVGLFALEHLYASVAQDFLLLHVAV